MDDESAAGDPTLDFLSPNFDPLKALSTSPSKILLPYPQVQPCDNLEVYKSVVRGTRKPVPTGNTETATQQLGNVDTSATIPSSKPMPLKQSGALQLQVKTVLSFMQRTDPGPFKILQRCQREGSRVKVWIRHCVGVRGVCEGVPVVYDQHMNIVLRDVLEHYTPFKTVANGGIEGPGRKKKKKKRSQISVIESSEKYVAADSHSPVPATTESSNKDQITSLVSSTITTATSQEGLVRQLKQLFIRGDNVLMVASISASQSDDSATT